MAYEPKLFRGESIEDLSKYLMDELEQIARQFSETDTVELRPIYAEPKNPRPGMIVYADGTSWDPGSGEGIYTYSIGGTWVQL